MDNFLGWTPEQIEDLINRVYGGVATRDNLPTDLYEALLLKFDEAIIDGFTGIDEDFIVNNSFNKIYDNIKDFSFAKTFQQINDMGNFILDSNGNQISFSDFKKSAEQIFEIYNNNWLETEFNTAKSISESAKDWADIQDNKDVLPLLKYSTVGDERVRASHRSLDEIIRPVNDDFWKTHYPPNDFNCRCIVEQIEEGEITDFRNKKIDPINPLFANNPMISGEVFKKAGHPYFKGLGNRKNDFEKEIIPEIKKTKSYNFTSKSEIKSIIKKDIESNSKIKINRIIFSGKLDLNQLNKRASKINELFSEYNLSEAIVNHKGTDLTFKSTSKVFGMVRSGYFQKTGKNLIASMNFGDKNASALSRVFNKPKGDRLSLRGKSAVDKENLDISTTVHEFAHVIATENSLKFKAKKDASFFKKLIDLKRQYESEVKKLIDAKDFKGVYEIHLGKYASFNINEFMAEGFTEYKLKTNPSKYAKLIGKLIDDNYKK